jgi:CTP:molybdopterin cytidylyltransferase MocA
VALALVILAGGRGSRFGGDKQLAPVGPGGEVILEYTVRDAAAAGFDTVVVVTRSDVAAALAARVDATVVCQDLDPLARRMTVAGRRKPLGTAHAALIGMRAAPDSPAAVVNADDLYDPGAWRLLAEHVRARPEAALVTFPVAGTIVGDEPVTRALCDVAPSGVLRGIEEGTVAGGAWTGRSGRRLALSGDEPVSMNCWGLPAEFGDVLDRACQRFDGGSDAEILLPDVAAAELGAGRVFVALRSAGRCIGLTHPGDLAVVRRLLADR